ncbi:hypothetical protein Q1695_000948 [Nippostrongylus brasiliensis]|nr:hypothetical protein Q1695_000948 [Nippostrongylus brasiliensis]
MKTLLLLSLLIDYSVAPNPCLFTDLNPGRQIVCDQIFNFNEFSMKIDVPNLASTILTFPGIPTTSTGGITMADAISGALPSDRNQCLSIECACGFIQGASYDGRVCNLPDGGQMGQVVRREIRTLSPAELSLYRQAFLAVRTTMYRDLGIIHSDFNRSPGAHSGPNFLGWHREFLKRLELAMRTTPVTVGGRTTYPYANVFIPYWMSAMDNEIIRTQRISPENSILFSNTFMGSVISGAVRDGIFGNFVGSLGRVTQRNLDQWNGQVSLFSYAEVSDIINNQGVNDLLAATAGNQGCPNVPVNNIELVHGDVHVWVGADMQQITTSTNDPIFYNHHSFIDSIWEQWRQARQTRAQRESQWNSSAHQFNAAMVPFTGLTNRVGLSNAYTDYLYTYAPYPSCNNGCGNSQYLWCDSSRGVCVSRLRPGSQCSRFNNVDPCYGTCSNGRCVAPAGAQSDAPVIDKTPPGDETLDEGCVNLHECCGSWAAEGNCDSNPQVMNTICPASCSKCIPKYNLADVCSDRHRLCEKYTLMGKCKTNQFWMAENCRKQCGMCEKSRRETCTGVSMPHASAETANSATGEEGGATDGYGGGETASETPEGEMCVNSHTCCSRWASQGRCKSSKDVMDKICAASCSCKPTHDLAACEDVIDNCSEFNSLGLCSVDYFAENCKKTCSSCRSKSELAAMCDAKEMKPEEPSTGAEESPYKPPPSPSPRPIVKPLPTEESGYN